jgi:hypothetical protein
MSNLEFRYLYRDGGNYKKFGNVIFSNPQQISSGTVEKALTEAFLEDGLFIADQVRVPDVFLFADGQLSFDDHCYHEFETVRTTDRNSTDAYARTIGEFLSEVTQQSQRGWRVFDPYDSKGSFGHLLASRLV